MRLPIDTTGLLFLLVRDAVPVHRIVKRAGVEHRGVHHMRHAWVTMLAERGVHERVAQHLAGHEDGRMTRQVYTHVTPPMFDATASVIDDAINDVVGSNNGSKANREARGDGGQSRGQPD